MARISYPDEASVSEDFKNIYRKARSREEKVLNLFKVMSHSPDVGFQFLRLGNAVLLKGIVPKALRELAILRVGDLCGARYEWLQHVPIALRVGVRQAQIDALSCWRSASEFDETEKAVLAYTDEVTLNIRVKDETFLALRSYLSEEQTVEMTVVVGYYGMVCRVLEAFQVEMEGK